MIYKIILICLKKDEDDFPPNHWLTNEELVWESSTDTESDDEDSDEKRM